jgi:signal transduction histidine kinase/CheY-like chemotaxis protein
MNIKDLYNQIPLGVCVIKRDRKRLKVLYSNNAMSHLVGEADITGKDFENVWQENDVSNLSKKLKSPTPPQSFTLSLLNKKTNKKRWILFRIQETEFEKKESFILWATDISDSKEAEERLQHAVEEADAAAEVKSNFLATMSHEIRTPMQSIYGLLELIGEEKPEEKIETMINTAKSSASGLLEILDDILDFAKMDAEKMELDNFEVPVRTLIYGINEALFVKVHGKDVELKDDIEKDVPFVVIGDPKRLRQVLMNLAGNALKFTKEGSVTIRVTTQQKHIKSPKNGLALRFEVIDTGIGMSQEACDRLFKPFSQADNSTSRKYGGTGLGLSICKKLVELMGGQIGVDSTEGKGSVFWFEVPTEEVSTEANTVNLPTLDGISVLSVEDHPQGAKEIVRSLESMGATIESCPTYAEGLELIKRRPFDVGIIDQGLPDGLGLDLIKQIMEAQPFMGLIMYTVRDDSGLQHSLQSLGVQYLSKPASRLGLGEAVKDASSKSYKINIDGPTRLLIAEDTESVVDVLQRQLSKLNVDADFVSNGKEALKAMKTGKYGILFTDLHMPEMDGYELTKIIRDQEKKNDNSHFPIIVLTADVQMAQRQTYLSNGFDECLLKPVSLGQLRRLLIRWGLLKSEEHQLEDTKPEEKPKEEESISPAVDIELVKEMMGGFDEGIIEMLHVFIEMTEPQLERITKAANHNDYHDLKEAAHSLKGASRSACCVILGDLAAKLQNDAEEKNIDKDVIDLIIKEFNRAKEEIKNLKAA